MRAKKIDKPKMDKDDRMWTIEECMDYLQIPRSTFYLLIARDEIPGKVKLGRATRFVPEIVKAYVKRKAS